MRIAILGSVATQIPPDGQAAIETLVYYQAIGLAEKGHKILLFAPKGSSVSHTNIELVEVGSGGTLTGTGKEMQRSKIKDHSFKETARKIPGISLPDNLDSGNLNNEEKYGSSYKLRLEIANLGLLISKLYDRKDDYDIVLNNLRGEAVVVPVLALLRKPMAHVMHLPLFEELVQLFKKYNTPLISISDVQKRAYPDLNYIATVYNGVDPDVFTYNETPKDYYLYLGSIGRNKNPQEAILACKAAGVKMIVGGRVKDQKYYETEIAPFITNQPISKIEWVGELNQGEVVKLYQNARAFLFPTLWQEPFGLVLIEAMSCGTPVLAYSNGAIPEIVRDGYNGYVVESFKVSKFQRHKDLNNIIKADGVEGLVEAIRKVQSFKVSKFQEMRRNARRTVEEKFTIEKMVEGYEKTLKSI